MFCRAFLGGLVLWTVSVGTSWAAVFYPSHFTLANGLQVVVVPNRLAPVVSQMVWYKVGAADEVSGKSGLAHYLEHLMFRGTDAIPPGGFSEAIAAQGGQDNAFTSHDYTAYYEKVEASRLAMVMQMEADRMQNLRLTRETADPELKVVYEERQQRTDNTPEGRFLEDLKQAFMPRYPYGRPVIGWKRDIKGLSVADVRAFYKTHYAPNNAVVVISGDVSVEEVMSLAAATYGRVPSRKVPFRKPLGEAPVPQKERVVLSDARVEQAELLWLVAAPSYATQKAREAWALEVLAEVLDGGEVGLLYQTLVRDKKVATALSVGYSPTVRGDSSFGISLSLRKAGGHQKVERMLRSFMRAWAQKGLEAYRVEEAKQRLQRAAIFAREGLMAPGYAFGVALTTGGSLDDVELWPERIEAVTVDDVNAALRSLMASKRQIVGVLLPKATPSVKKARKRSKVPHKEGL